MKNLTKRLKSLLNNMANAKTIAHKKHSSDSGAPEEVFLLNEVDRIPGKYYPEVDDYKDKYRYRHMDPTDKKTPKRRPLRSFPKKEVYKCFGWQLHPYDIEKLASYIIANPRLSLVVGQSALEGAAEADILVLTSGSGKYHMDSFLADLDTSNKLIIIASVRDIESVQQDIKHRIDAHFNKLLPFSQSDFDKLIDRVIEEAFVKQSAPQPEDEVVGMLKK